MSNRKTLQMQNHVVKYGHETSDRSRRHVLQTLRRARREKIALARRCHGGQGELQKGRDLCGVRSSRRNAVQLRHRGRLYGKGDPREKGDLRVRVHGISFAQFFAPSPLAHPFLGWSNAFCQRLITVGALRHERAHSSRERCPNAGFYPHEKVANAVSDRGVFRTPCPPSLGGAKSLALPRAFARGRGRGGATRRDAKSPAACPLKVLLSFTKPHIFNIFYTYIILKTPKNVTDFFQKIKNSPPPPYILRYFLHYNFSDHPSSNLIDK